MHNTSSSNTVLHVHVLYMVLNSFNTHSIHLCTFNTCSQEYIIILFIYSLAVVNSSLPSNCPSLTTKIIIHNQIAPQHMYMYMYSVYQLCTCISLGADVKIRPSK